MVNASCLLEVDCSEHLFLPFVLRVEVISGKESSGQSTKLTDYETDILDWCSIITPDPVWRTFFQNRHNSVVAYEEASGSSSATETWGGGVLGSWARGVHGRV